MNTSNEPSDFPTTRNCLIVGIYDDRSQAESVLARLLDEDFPMDRISLLSRAGRYGDDILGVSYAGTSEKMKIWGAQGALWGGILGMLAGASGLFVLPGLGVLLAAGPVVDALGGAIGAGAISAGVVAGAAGLSGLADALHRLGIPEAHLLELQQAVRRGETLLTLQWPCVEAERFAARLAWSKAVRVLVEPLTP